MKLDIKKIDKEVQECIKSLGIEFEKYFEEDSILYSRRLVLKEKYNIFLRFFFSDDGGIICTLMFDRIEKTKENCKLVNKLNAETYASEGTFCIDEKGFLTLYYSTTIYNEKTSVKILYKILANLSTDSFLEEISVFDDLFIKDEE